MDQQGHVPKGCGLQRVSLGPKSLESARTDVCLVAGLLLGGCRYINGIDVDQEGTLHVSWTWRDYVPVTLAESRQQAGPNGPENVSLCFGSEVKTRNTPDLSSSAVRTTT